MISPVSPIAKIFADCFVQTIKLSLDAAITAHQISSRHMALTFNLLLHSFPVNPQIKGMPVSASKFNELEAAIDCDGDF